MNSSNRNIVLLGLVVLLVLSAITSCSLGAAQVPVGALLSILGHKLGFADANGFTLQQEAIVWGIRFPRVLLGIGVGASLGICGAAIQGLFRNPLADPTVIGITSGAALSAALVIVVAHGWAAALPSFLQVSFLSLGTFVGAILSTLAVFALSVSNGRASVVGMLLTGIAINAFAMSAMGLLIFASSESQLRTLTFWTLGSLGGATWTSATVMGAIALLVVVGLVRMHKPLNLLSLGEAEAAHAGISTESLKRQIVVFTALAVGTSVAISGIIGFVGLVVPHMIRLTGTSDNRLVLPASAIGGAALLCIADTISRVVVIPAEIPIGVITGLIGAPMFLFLLMGLKQKNTLA